VVKDRTAADAAPVYLFAMERTLAPFIARPRFFLQ